MNRFRTGMIAVLVILLSFTCLAAWSQALTYSNSELDEILAPIALYPDPLIAQVLPAATYPDQLSEAYDLMGQRNGARGIDGRYWDVSVKAVAHYPSVLDMMVEKPDWTTAVGQAYIDEPDHVMWSIQRLRAKARSYGYLSTNKYQRIYLDSGHIRIVPVQARYIYVPRYNPQVVYVRRSSSSNLVSFGLGLLIGVWLNRDVDWHRDRVYYHGWTGGGWIGNSRTHVSVANQYYVNSNWRDQPIAVDRTVKTRGIGDYRNRIRSSAGRFQPTNYPRPTRAPVSSNRTKARPVARWSVPPIAKSHEMTARPSAKSNVRAARPATGTRQMIDRPTTRWPGDHTNKLNVTKTQPVAKSHWSGRPNGAPVGPKSDQGGRNRGHSGAESSGRPNGAPVGPKSDQGGGNRGHSDGGSSGR